MSSQPVPGQPSDLDLILALDDRWNAAYHHRDPGRLDTVLADDWLGFYHDGTTVTKQELLTGMQTNPTTPLIFERHAARVHGDTAVTRGTLYAAGTRVQSFLRVYARRDGHWQAVSVQVIP